MTPWQNILVLLIRCMVVLYTYTTWPIYYAIQRPRRLRAKHNRIRSVPIIREEDSIVYHSIAKLSDVNVRLVQDKIDTMEKVFRFAIRQHGQKRAIGTREVIAEEDEIQPNGKIFKKLVLGNYQWRTFTEMESEAESFGRGLRELGVNAKDNVVLFADTRAEWLISANACMKQNMTLVTLYATLGEDALVHGINETEACCVVTSQELLPKFKNILGLTPNVTALVVMEDPLKPLDSTGYADSVRVIAYREVIRLGDMSSKSGVVPKADDIAIIMYTSGSTGPPKGVLLSHKNIVGAMLALTNMATIYENDVYMAYLPLAHVLELIAESMCMLLFGIPIGYATPLTMTDTSSKIKRGSKGDATILRPTVIASVPLILDRIYKAMQAKVEKNPLLHAVFNMSVEYKIKWFQRGYGTPIIDRTVFKPIRALLGGELRFIISGGAPLSPDIHEVLRAALCCPILQGYGLTETCAATTVMDTHDITTGKTGGPLACCDIKLVNWEEGNYRVKDVPNPRGEIHVGGSNVCVGYYKQPDKTREEFYYDENGRHWFRTGDIGEFSREGVLKIIDRKKDLVKLQYGEYVSLGKVESELKTYPLVENVCLYADPTKLFTVALIVPNIGQLKTFAQKNGIHVASLEELCFSAQIEKLALTEIQQHCAKCRLEKFEIPQAVKLIPEAWTPESNLVTAALKLKRKNIQDRYQELIDRMYS